MGRLLYVGITMSVEARFRAHRHGKSWWDEIATIDLTHYGSARELDEAEVQAIYAEKPLYNLREQVELGQPPKVPPRLRTVSGTRPQLIAQIDDELERDTAVNIAKLRGERDLIGRGLSVVIRRAVRDYVRANLDDCRDQLSPELQRRLNDAGR